MSWSERTMYNGRFERISDLIRNGSHYVEHWGNSEDGWAIYLMSKAVPNAGLQVSPIFDPKFGDRLRDLKEAAGRAFEIHEVRRGRDWL